MNTRDRCGACLMLMLFLFAFPAQCHPHQQQLGVGAARRSRAYSLTDTTLDEIKLRLKFCTQRVCDKRLCYCCWNEKPESLCYGTWQECKNECPLCNPKCPPGQSTTA
ncbi:hypothetical protein PAHAL_4G350400 [Panicum hallii]|uniref:Embryo surrounding factor 1 brassicaceae domain-containing protein n=1 Tax=Panicum hallii TaxID=206008 RepID=A0A2S3HMC9_9POAL|nr:hypothetical protein PAHAL_4G350400 [Panicum hallii]